MARAQKCAGGCGKTQDVTVDPKGGTKGSFTLMPPWTCADCRAKEEKRRASEQTKKDVAKAGPEKAPDKGFTLVPRSQKTIAPPVPAMAVPQASEKASDPIAAPPEEAKAEEAQPPEVAEA